ncbi:MAG: ferritin-like domain-containing protein [Elusimicrobia bacterium]|nr:ferritin-like domain-containing protein [Elusimicrobiota bacterium]
MPTWLEALRVKLLVRLAWGLSKSRYLDSLRLFSATEADSAWQLLYAADKVDDPAQRADLLGQVLEETHHAELFKGLYNEDSASPLVPAKYEREALYWDKAEMWKFFIYCYVGEDAAATRFTHIRDAATDPRLIKTLDSILADEVGHVHGAREFINELGISEEQFQRESGLIRWRRRWEAWLRTGRNVTDLASTGFLSAVYWVLAPLGAGIARRRRTASSAGWS